MLEVKNICKTYRPKKGAETKALDGVSVAFPETGMVFLLGKSGSGKSTLLNICGGLDKADSGEIVIKGRSSKDFTATDFDSYRNTLVGFVFQEYNILYEFSVEDNIALALELQNRKRDPQKIDEILKSVDLKEFAKRKPNTLSGGQKQRVAIARALVKEPQIILADEPTGALDSATGRQVLDTLKKLSSDKLVIVVSHDREFAENYADRIIELKDGKIISDRTREGDTALLKNVQFIGNDTIAVRDGSALTDEDMAAIRQFLSAAKGGAVLSTDGEAIQQTKNAAPNEITGVFEKTREQPKTRAYSIEEQTFIRSRMPFRHAFRMGAGSMKAKPFRLVFTIFLSFIAFTMFGLFSTLTFYNEKNVELENYIQSGYEYIALKNNYREYTVEYNNGKEISSQAYSYRTKFTPEQLEQYRKKYGTVAGLYNYGDNDYGYSRSFPVSNVENSNLSSYYLPQIQYFAEISEQANIFNILTDTDISQLGKNGIVISSYMFDTLKETTLLDSNGNAVPLNEYEDIIGKRLYVYGDARNEDVELEIKGVYRLDLPAKFDPIKNNESASSNLYSSLDSELSNGLYCSVLVSEEFYSAHVKEFSYISYDIFEYLQYPPLLKDADESTWYFYEQVSRIAPFTDANATSLPYLYMFEEGKTSLSDNEIVVPALYLEKIIQDFYENIANGLRQSAYDNCEHENPEKLQAYTDELFGEKLQNIYSHGEYKEIRKDLEQKYFDDNYTALYEQLYDGIYLEYYKQIYPDRYEQFIARFKENNPSATQDEAESYADEQALISDNYYVKEFADDEFEANLTRNAYKYAQEHAPAIAAERAREYAINSAKEKIADEVYSQFSDEYEKNKSILFEGEYVANDTWQNATPEETEQALAYFKDLVYSYGSEYEFSIPQTVLIDDVNIKFGTEFTIAGITYGDDYYMDGVFFSPSVYDSLIAKYGYEDTDDDDNDYESNSYWTTETKYELPENAKYDLFALQFPDRDVLSELIYGSNTENTADDSFYDLFSPISATLSQINPTIELCEQIFLYVGLAMALFSMLLLFNFISVSITYKKKEIGILRAIGAKSSDVFKIFYSESAIIALICFALAMIACFVTCGILNNTISAILGASLLVFGPLSWLFMLGIALFTSIIATFLPVYGIAKRRPVESIRSL